MLLHAMTRRLLTGTALCLIPIAAVAQTAPAAPAPTIPDIIVTATRDKTLVSKTPISMKVYSAEDVAQKGINNAATLIANDSSLTFNQGGGEPYIAMRGVQSSDTTEVGDPAVPVSVDNFFTNRAYGLNVGFFDLDRIEVLRGPQGTLFGRNAVGGLINIYTANPTKELGGFGEVTAGNYGTINTTGALNVPLSNTLQARVSFATNHHSGYRDLGALGKGDDQNTQAVRLKVLWSPTDSLKFTASYQYSNVDQSGSTHYTPQPKFLAPAPTTDAAGHLTGQTVTPIDTSVPFTTDPENFAPGVGIPPLEQLRQHTLIWKAEYQPANGISVSYLGGYEDLKWAHEAALGPAGVNSSFEQKETPKTLNQELRISSPQDGRLRWQIGAFYFHEHNTPVDQTIVNYLTPTPFIPLAFFLDVKSSSLAGYGQASYAVTDKLKITGGGRYTRDAKTTVGKFCAFFFGPPPNNCIPSDGHLPAEGTWTYHFGVDYQATPGTLAYAKADKGYKSGGYNNGTPYNPEINYAYEAGLKTRLFDNMLSLNAAGFYSIYKDFQVFISQPPSSGLTSAVVNAGRAKIYGLELGGVLNGNDLGKVDFGATLLHARFTDFTTGNDRNQLVNGVVPANVSYKDNQLPNSPNLTFTVGYQDSFSVLGGKITPRIEGKYTSDKYFLSSNTPDTLVKANFIANAYLTFVSGDGRYTVEGYVRNIANKAVLDDFNYSQFAELTAGAFAPSYAAAYGFAPPRTFGARLRVNF